MYNVTHTDDGSCKLFKSQQLCLEKPSVYNSQQSKCLWTISEEADKSHCSFREANSSMFAILYVATICCTISTPLNLIIDWIVMNILLAKTLRRRTSRVAPDSKVALTAKKSALAKQRRKVYPEPSAVAVERRGAVRLTDSKQVHHYSYMICSLTNSLFPFSISGIDISINAQSLNFNLHQLLHLIGSQ